VPVGNVYVKVLVVGAIVVGNELTGMDEVGKGVATVVCIGTARGWAKLPTGRVPATGVPAGTDGWIQFVVGKALE